MYASVAQQARERGWPVRELATGHLPQLTTPEELSALLVEMGTERIKNKKRTTLRSGQVVLQI
ncbi:MAG: hypothetical protein JOZ18_15595 [Chloroflexi bacterium]|nr:hypothetical protein [Chloroflexota bacterium]